MRTETEIKQYIIDEFVPDIAIADLDSDLNLVESGMIDSLAVLKIMAALENSMDILIEPEELDVENFSTVRAIETLIERKLAECV